MIAGLIIGAAVMFFTLIGLYLVRHIRVMQKIQTGHYDRMVRFEKAMERVTSQQATLRNECRDVRIDVRALRTDVNALSSGEEEDERARVGGTADWGFAEECEEKPTPLSAWSELMGNDEP